MSDPLAILHEDLRGLVGKTIAGRYHVESLLGVGGMAAVFRAHHEGLKRDLAIKVLHPNLSANTEMSARFEREARSASRLDHPNCVQVTDFGSTEDGVMYMVMQLLEGAELTRQLRRPIPAPRAVELVLQILRGLEHAHEQGVVHRDIKPENVFVTRDRHGDEILKLVDFGIAKLTDTTIDTHKTSAGLVFGTPAYMSPEQAMGVEADSRADLYSTGVLFYQMLAGRLPIDNEDPVSLVRMQVSVDPDPLPAKVPPIIAGVVERMLEKDRDKRFQTASEVIQTLESIEPMLVDEHISDFEITMPGSSQSVAASLPAQPATPSVARAASGGWKWASVVGAVLLIGGATWVLTRDDAQTDAEQAQVVAVETSEVPEPSGPREQGPNAAVVAEVDRLLLAKRAADAQVLLDPLLDEFPDDASLIWRNGRAMALRRRKTPEALELYSRALEADPQLVDDKDFYAELHDLLRTRAIRKQAVAFSLEHHGDHGDKFLLETVNDEKQPLQYDRRHEVLAALRKNPDNTTLINEQLNLALDIMQASDASKPCVSYAKALDAVAAAPEFYFYNRVDKAKVPTAPEDPDADTEDDISRCAELPARREALLALLAPLDPDAPVDAEANDEAENETPEPAPKAKRRSSSGKRSKSDQVDCSKFGAGLRKQCRNK